MEGRPGLMSGAAVVLSLVATAVGGGFAPSEVTAPEVTAARSEASIASDAATNAAAEAPNADQDDDTFTTEIRPILEGYCFECHGPDEQEADLRFDELDPDMVEGVDGFIWEYALDLIGAGDMPPRSAKPLPDDERRKLTGWIRSELERAARATAEPIRPVVRRLNRAQYTAALQDLLALPIDFGARLPADGTSHMGFSNDGETLRSSPLHFELFQQIARDALDAAIVSGEKPEPTRYRVTYGRGVGLDAVGGTTGGYQSVPLSPDHFVVEVLDAEGEAKEPVDADERAALDAVKRRITTGFRGSSADRFHVVEEGVVLYGALPHKEVAPGAWQGPSPNMKLEMQRVFPRRGDFVLRVEASRGYLVAERRELLVPLDEQRTEVAIARREGGDEPTDAERRAMEPADFGPWYLAGPIPADSGEEARDTVYANRTDIDFDAPLLDGETKWREVGQTDGAIQTYQLDIGSVLLARRIESPSPRTVDIAIGSDDAVWIWLNGEEVLGADVRRGVGRDQNFLSLDLVAGTNELVMKVVNYGGGFGSFHRIVHAGVVAGPTPVEVVAAREARVIAASRATTLENVRFEDGVLLPQDVPADSTAAFMVEVPAGYWQFDVVHPTYTPDAMRSVRLEVGDLKLDLRPTPTDDDLARGWSVTPIGAGYLTGGARTISVGGPFFTGFSHLVLTPLGKGHSLVQRLEAADEQPVFEEAPALRAFIGTRTDDGMDYAEFGGHRAVDAPLESPRVYEFHGRLENLPIPEEATAADDELSGICVVGVWNDHLVKSRRESGPPLLVHAIEFEAPYHPVWPPRSHTRIFHPSANASDEAVYAREILVRFLPRAFRREVTDDEVERYHAFWSAIREDCDSFEHSVKETLVAVLCSPHFLLMAEPEDARDDEGRIEELVLANRLAFFLWNAPPDARLVQLAERGQLRANLAAEVDRMLALSKSDAFVRTFTREWLRMDRLEGMTINPNRFPDFTRFVKRDMAEECYRFVGFVLREGLPLETLIDSDFALLNQNLAEFYGVPGVEGGAFRPVPLAPGAGRGGIITQGAFLVGHSDGNEPHPIKRAVWVKEKLLGQPPLPPPPNVPALDASAPATDGLTLKQRIEMHRDDPSCYDCHAGLDPYGVVLEDYDAVGRYAPERMGQAVDASAELPDGTAVEGAAGLKQYLLGPGRAAFEASVIEHLFAYALGRETNFVDEPELRSIAERVRAEGSTLRAVIHAIVDSPSFRDR